MKFCEPGHLTIQEVDAGAKAPWFFFSTRSGEEVTESNKDTSFECPTNDPVKVLWLAKASKAVQVLVGTVFKGKTTWVPSR